MSKGRHQIPGSTLHLDSALAKKYYRDYRLSLMVLLVAESEDQQPLWK